MEAAVMAVAAMAVVPPAGLTDPSVHNPNDCGIGDLFSGAVWLFKAGLEQQPFRMNG
jgi:hypothetical protein